MGWGSVCVPRNPPNCIQRHMQTPKTNESLRTSPPAFYAVTESVGFLVLFKRSFRQFPLSFHRLLLNDQMWKMSTA